MCGKVWYMWGKTSLRRTACTRFAQESSLPLFLALLLLYKQKIDLILSISIYRKASVFSDASVGRIHSSAMSDSTHRPHLHNYVTQCLHKHAYRHMLLTCTHTHTLMCTNTCMTGRHTRIHWQTETSTYSTLTLIEETNSTFHQIYLKDCDVQWGIIIILSRHSM